MSSPERREPPPPTSIPSAGFSAPPVRLKAADWAWVLSPVLLVIVSAFLAWLFVESPP